MSTTEAPSSAPGSGSGSGPGSGEAAGTGDGRLLGRRVQGPSALGGDARRFWTLTVALAVTDFKLRFFGTALGYLWQLMRPLALFGVLYVIFSVVLSLDDAPFYPEALLLGLVLYTFLSDATKGSVGSIVSRESLVRKIEFPRLAVPLSVVLTALFNLAMNLLPVFVFLVIDGGRVRWSWLELPLLIGALTVLSTGIAMGLSSLYVRYRDIDPIWEVSLFLLFYGSPIFYTVDLIEQKAPGASQYLMLNPFAVVLQQTRHAVLGPGHPSAWEASGAGGALILVPVLVSVAVVIAGWLVFRRLAPRIAEEL